jgi:hypothetical protein
VILVTVVTARNGYVMFTIEKWHRVFLTYSAKIPAMLAGGRVKVDPLAQCGGRVGVRTAARIQTT